MKKTILFLFLSFFCLTTFAQNHEVTGVVTSGEDDTPIPFASVVLTGTTSGTSTDFDGKYAISVPNGAIISYSMIGFETVEVLVGDQTEINVVLQTQTTGLDEVVVVGYGVQKKSVVSAAISSVSAEDLKNETPSRLENVLKGKVSGVQITQSSGAPGSDSKVRIRGIGTVNDSDPLFIVDGMAVDGGIDNINPTDIASVEVLKDAASAAIYGTRGANGVILITTKTGAKGKAKITYDFSYGFQNPWKKKSVLNPKEYMTIMNEIELNDGNDITYSQSEIANAGDGTDWQDEVFNYNAPIQNHQFSISGATDRNNYFVSFGYNNQEGIIGGDYDRSNFERYTIRVNNTYKVFAEDRKFFKDLKVGVNTTYGRILSQSITANSEYGSVLGSALGMDPTLSVYSDDPDGDLEDHPYAVTNDDGDVYSLAPDGFQEIVNPVAKLDQPYNSYFNSDKIVANFWAELELLKNLKFKSSYGIDLAFWGSDGYSYEYYLSSQSYSESSSVWSSMNRGFRWQLENTLTYTKSINEKHNFTALIGQSASEYKYRYLSGTDYDLASDDSSKANIDYATADEDDSVVSGGTGGYDSKTLASYFARLDYNFDEKYMFQATVRMDGSSSFGDNNKWGTFPSFSVGWNVTNENFMTNKPAWFDYMKLRFSWGINGNENIEEFAYASYLSSGENYYFGSGDYSTMQSGYSSGRLANEDVKWEQSVQTDVGVDLRLFNHSLSIGMDYFKKTTKDMLATLPIPDYVGKSAPYGNAGTMENQGLEFEVTYKGNVGDFNYSVGAQASYITNKLIDMGNESGETIYLSNSSSGLGSYVKGSNGEVWPYFYGYRTNGILQTDAAATTYNNTYGESAVAGDVQFVDYNGDGIIDADDKTKIGKGMPDWTYGLNISADYKDFDLSMFFQGTIGNDMFDFSQRGDIPLMNRPTWILNRWTGEGSSNKIPRVTSDDTNSNWRSSDLYIKNGSYLRLKSIQLGYTIPSSIIKKNIFERIRVYVAADNLLTFTDYDGMDPEVASDDYTSIGVDKGVYPQSRTIIFGANINF
jgi:TonB-linked SusC/RagA family outer membrane protein